ncbi:MAG: InlB B-repeat-containing protein [Spirochaetaceae bacterium]|nr:InlB B-repeat-containing protein [Spirochaetaceae bacterium]
MKKNLFGLIVLLTGLIFTSCDLITAITDPPSIRYTVNLSVNPTDAGTATTAATTVDPGTEVSLLATAGAQYEFIGWTGDYTGTVNPVTVTVNSNMNVTAQFQLQNYTLTTTVNDSAMGSIIRNPDAAGYEAMTVVDLTATAEPGYNFLNWDGDLQSQDGANASVYMDGAKTITANFISDTTPTYTVNTSASPSAGGTTSPTSTDVLATGTEDVTLTALANEGYRFGGWYDGITPLSNEETFLLEDISANRTITANFIKTYNVTVSALPAIGGTVTTSDTVVDEGDTVNISAAANSGYIFTGWSGDYSGTTNPAIVSVNSEMEIIADFQLNSSWTILVHFAVDNDIDYDFEENYGFITDYLTTLEAIEAGDLNDNINIVVLMDSYNSMSNFQDGYYHLTGGTFSGDIVTAKTEINSGSLSDTQEFMDWAVAYYPADKYVYSIFNHGSGFDDLNIEGTYGIGFDDSNNDSLSHNELQQTTAYLKGLIGHNIEMFFPYACLMGGVELAYEVRNNVDYLLFSEELYPADYWSYEALSAITADPTITGADLGQAFCDNAYDYFTDPSTERDFTLSIIDLSAMDTLYNSINSFATAALSDIGGSDTIAAYYNTAAEDAFSMYYDFGMEWYYMDLGDYLSNIVLETGIGSSVRSSASNLLTALDNAVIYDRNNGYPDSTGMTIFHNIWNESFQYSLALYSSLLSFSSNQWTSYLTTMASLVIIPPGDSYEPDNSFAEASSISVGAAAQNHNINIPGDNDYIQFNMTAGNWYKIETYDNGGSSMDTELFLFNSLEDPIAYNDDNNGLYSSITYECTSSGNYYAMIQGFSNTSTGDYSIDVQQVAAIIQDSYEPDDSTGSPIGIGETQNHNLHSVDDVDVVYFDAIAGQDYTIRAAGDSDILDMYLYAEGDYETVLASGFIGSNINFSCTTSGVYAVAVMSYSNGVGDYTIDLGSGTYSQHSNFGRNKIK